MNGCGCSVTISESDPRASIWLDVFGKRSFPLKHPLYMLNDGFPGKRFLEGDASSLTSSQVELLVEKMAEKFHVPESHVRETIESGMVPILAENTTVCWCRKHSLSAML